MSEIFKGLYPPLPKHLEAQVDRLEQQLAELREYAFVCIEMQRAGLPTKGAIASMEAAIEEQDK